jgi:hypothetical protein
MHGYYWQHLYTATWLHLPIAVLEFLALAVSIIVFAPLLDHAAHIVIETDSITAALVLSADAARSPYLQEAHSLLAATPEYATLLTGLTNWRQVEIGHIYGPANIAADYISRGNMLAFAHFCLNMGVVPRYLPLPPAAWAYLDAFFSAMAPVVPPELHGRARSPASADYDGPLSEARVFFSARPSSPGPSAPPANPHHTRPDAAAPAQVRPISSADPLLETSRLRAADASRRPAPPTASRYALQPASGLAHAAFCERRDRLLQAAVPATTLASEKRSWALWVQHCQTWGTDPWRGNLLAYSLSPDSAGPRHDELFLAASFIESCYLSMEPRARGTHPKPASAYRRWGDIARIHRRCGFPRLDPAQLGAFVRALTLDYKARFGFDSLLPRRKEPIRDAEHRHLLNLPDDLRLGPFLYKRRSRFGLTWRTLLQVLNHSGFRKAEWTVRRRGDATLMTYKQLVWELDGTPRPSLPH